MSGEISVIRGSDACNDVIQINKPMPVAAVAADLVTQSAGLEFIVATDDGTLICMGHKNSFASPEKRYHHAKLMKSFSILIKRCIFSNIIHYSIEHGIVLINRVN